MQGADQTCEVLQMLAYSSLANLLTSLAIPTRTGLEIWTQDIFMINYIVYAAGGPIAWQSRLQTTVAVSTMEAANMAAFGAIQELIWIKGC